MIVAFSISPAVTDDTGGVSGAVEVVAASSPRVGLVLKADIRPGYDGQLTAKVERIEQQLGAAPADPAQ